ncbi:hypothetical protein Tco_1082751 [Tanacetum coccineum]|uniref:Uncharacterized protein n=1 Tax=Tanacetum coccineum TaxID=301880 RepID=A0ABQ5I199_9ASTR
MRRRKSAMAKVKTSKKIDWNDPSVIRLIFEKVWDFNQNIEPMDVEHGSEKQKSPEKIVEEEVDTQEEMKEVVKEPGAKRKKSIPRKSTRKIQKLEENAEKGDGSSKNYKILSEMLKDFDRHDVEELYRLVKEKYSASRLEGFDLMLWGDFIRERMEEAEEEVKKRRRDRREEEEKKKLGDLKDNHKFRGGLLGINLHKT